MIDSGKAVLTSCDCDQVSTKTIPLPDDNYISTACGHLEMEEP